MKTHSLTAIRLPGINTDSLGNYLVSLGLLSALSTRWSRVRACWVDEQFVLLSDEIKSVDEVVDFLVKDWKPTEYRLWWSTSQKADTKAKSSHRIWTERNEKPASEVAMLDAHIVGLGRNVFNPILGTGGNVGKRNLAKACSDASKLLKKPDSRNWAIATLQGQCDTALPQLSNGGTWFVFANKTFNSGRKWSQEGLLSPWSVLLATEGSFQLVGGINRRLSSRARSYAVFPFISEPVSPSVSGEVAMVTAEFWAPLWKNPSTIAEIQAMLRRGMAKVGNRNAKSPHEFAVAAVSAGVDAGIESFARYELRQTTSSQVYEAIPQPAIQVSGKRMHESQLLIELIESGWLDRMPFEPHDSKQKGKFVGLRGPVETAITRVATQPDEPEVWQSLLLTLASTQQRIDQNQRLRKQCVPLPPLSVEWFEKAWCDGLQSEIEVAAAIGSVGKISDSDPICFNVFGIEGFGKSTRRFRFMKARPARVVWNTGDPVQNLVQLAQRRLIDSDAGLSMPLNGAFKCSPLAVGRFLCGELDLELIAKWIPPLSLIDWSQWKSKTQRFIRPSSASGLEILHALFRPIFSGVSVGAAQHASSPQESTKPKSRLLRRLMALLRSGEIDEAVRVAKNFYLSQRVSIVVPSTIESDSELVAAGLLIPMRAFDVRRGLDRWLIPEHSPST